MLIFLCTSFKTRSIPDDRKITRPLKCSTYFYLNSCYERLKSVLRGQFLRNFFRKQPHEYNPIDFQASMKYETCSNSNIEESIDKLVTNLAELYAIILGKELCYFKILA